MTRAAWPRAAVAAAILALALACRPGQPAAEGGLPPGAAGERALPAVAHDDRREAVPVRTTSGVAPFFVLARESELTKGPCVTCHAAPSAAPSADAGPRRAHWSVELAHAPESVMSCATCHAPSAGLRTLAGRTVEFDHGYEVCAQCHSTARDDWEGGAHGKRAGGWPPPRVVFSCTECHNPHRPALETRWPARSGAPR